MGSGIVSNIPLQGGSTDDDVDYGIIKLQLLSPIVCVKTEGTEGHAYRTASGKYDDVVGQIYLDATEGRECCRFKLSLDHVALAMSRAYRLLAETPVSRSTDGQYYTETCRNDSHKEQQKILDGLIATCDIFDVTGSTEQVDVDTISIHPHNVYARHGSGGKVKWLNSEEALLKKVTGKAGNKVISLGLGATCDYVDIRAEDSAEAMIFATPEEHMTTVTIPRTKNKAQKNADTRDVLKLASDREDLVNRSMVAVVTKMCSHRFFSFQMSPQVVRNMAFLLAHKINGLDPAEIERMKDYLQNPTGAEPNPDWKDVAVVSADHLKEHTDQDSYEQGFADMVTGWKVGDAATRNTIGPALVIAHGIDTTKSTVTTALNERIAGSVTRESQLKKKVLAGGGSNSGENQVAAAL